MARGFVTFIYYPARRSFLLFASRVNTGVLDPTFPHVLGAWESPTEPFPASRENELRVMSYEYKLRVMSYEYELRVCYLHPRGAGAHFPRAVVPVAATEIFPVSISLG